MTLDAILATKGKSASTLSGWASARRWWQSFCAARDVDPWTAPFDVWEQAIKDGRRHDGRRYGWDYYSLIERAVAREHHDRHLPPPAPRQPLHAAAWAEMGRGYRARLNLEWSKDRATYNRSPLLREDICALLNVGILDMPESSTAEQSGRDGGVRRTAERLILLDTGCSANSLARVTRDQITTTPAAVRVTVAGVTHLLPHDHAERVHGLPWDCTPCAVTERLGQVAIEGRLFHSRAAVQVADGRWPGLERSFSRLIECPNLTTAERAGIRRGLVLSAHRPKEWTWWLLGRAWIAMSWEAGFRMAGDLVTLDRSWCTQLSGGEGFRVRLHATKDDQNGAKAVSRPFRFNEDGGPSAAAMLAEYLAVRDAKLGPSGPLLWWGGDPSKGRAQGAAVRCITTLAAAADVNKKFRSYSPRKGYSEQSAEDGRPLESRQRGLRHASGGTTTRHYPASADSLASTDLMMQRLIDQLGAQE